MNKMEKMVVAASTAAAVNLVVIPAAFVEYERAVSADMCGYQPNELLLPDSVLHCDEAFTTRMGEIIDQDKGLITGCALAEMAMTYLVLIGWGRKPETEAELVAGK